MRLWVLLLLVPLASADNLALNLATDLRVQDTVLASGRLTFSDLELKHPVSAGSKQLTFEPGTLTVCPLNSPRSAVLQALQLIDPQCPGAEAFEDPEVTFQGRSTLQWAGRYAVTSMPQAAVAAIYGFNATVGLLVPDAELGLRRDGDYFRFTPLTVATAVVIRDGARTAYFNGTGYGFLHDAAAGQMTAGGWAASVPDPFRMTLTPSGEPRLADCFQPAILLDLQEGLLGPDAREPRSNASLALGEYSRLWRVVDGAVLGYLNGTAGGNALNGKSNVLLRAESWELTRRGTVLEGHATLDLMMQPQGVWAGDQLRQPPWLLYGLLALAALVVVAVRRKAPARPWLHRVVGLAGVLWAALVADRFVMANYLGASPTTELGSPPAALFAAFVYLLVLVGAAWVVVGLPVRIILGRVLRHRFLLAAEGAWALLWPLLMWVAAGFWLATANAFVRL